MYDLPLTDNRRRPATRGADVRPVREAIILLCGLESPGRVVQAREDEPAARFRSRQGRRGLVRKLAHPPYAVGLSRIGHARRLGAGPDAARSRLDLHVERDGLGSAEEHTSELQSLLRLSYAALCLRNK